MEQKWKILLRLYSLRVKNRISPTAVPQIELRNNGVTEEDIQAWKAGGHVRVLRTINDSIIKPLHS